MKNGQTAITAYGIPTLLTGVLMTVIATMGIKAGTVTAGTIALTTVACCKGTQTEKRRAIQELERKLSDSKQVNQDHQKTIYSLQDEMRQNGVRHVEALSKKTQQLEYAQTAWKDGIVSKGVLETQIATKTKELEELNLLKIKEAEVAVQTLTEAIEALKAEHEETLKGYDELITDLEKQLDDLPRQYSTQISAGKAENNALRQQTERLYQVVEGYNAPKRLDGSSRAVHNANRLADWYLNQEIAVDVVKAESKDCFDEIYLKPRQGGLRVLEGLSSDIHLDLELLDEPKFSTQDGSVRVRLKVEKGLDKSEQTVPVKESADWFKNVVLGSKHFRFVGESESGKSTIVNNVIGILRSEMPDLVVKLADPVWESDSNNWKFQAEWTDAEGSIEALKEAADLVVRRSVDADLPRTPTLYIIDEIDTLAADFPKELVAENIKRVWKRGRHFGVYLMIVGQSPNVRTLKLLRADVKNAANFYLGSSAPEGIRQAKLLSTKETKLLNQYHLKIENGLQYQVYVEPKGKSSFLATAPKPDEFVSMEPSPNDVKRLASEGLKVAAIVERLYGIKPTRSQVYLDMKAKVEAELKG